MTTDNRRPLHDLLRAIVTRERAALRRVVKRAIEIDERALESLCVSAARVVVVMADGEQRERILAWLYAEALVTVQLAATAAGLPLLGQVLDDIIAGAARVQVEDWLDDAYAWAVEHDDDPATGAPA